MAEFGHAFFEAEERNGFFIESMMKRTWAAEVEVLEEIEKICRKHEIKYFADGGTLLGTIRHKGFIPCDDDIDIVMFREDYDKFLHIVSKELPKGFVVGEVRANSDWSLECARVLNGLEIGYGNEERMKRFHGCPYIVGVDIFVLDNMPIKKEDEALQIQLLCILKHLSREVAGLEQITEEVEETLRQIEKLFKVKINREGILRNEILKLFDRVCCLYQNDECNEVTFFHWMLGHENYRFKKEWYADVLWMPFETVKVPVPVGYDEILKVTYGEDYMIPKNIAAGHDYPIYKAQEELLRKENLNAKEENKR